MKLTSELPIYRDTFELVSLVFDYVPAFPKLFKYSIGQRMLDTSLALFEYIQLANRAGKDHNAKVKYLQEFLIKFELLKVLIRLCNEKRIISIKQTAQLAVLVSSIGKQATAWKNS